MMEIMGTDKTEVGSLVLEIINGTEHNINVTNARIAESEEQALEDNVKLELDDLVDNAMQL